MQKKKFKVFLIKFQTCGHTLETAREEYWDYLKHIKRWSVEVVIERLGQTYLLSGCEGKLCDG